MVDGQEDGVRAAMVGGAQRHAGMDAVLARLVRGGGDDAPPRRVAAAADDHGLAPQLGVAQQLDGGKEGIHVDVKDPPLATPAPLATARAVVVFGLGHQRALGSAPIIRRRGLGSFRPARAAPVAS